MDRVVVVGCGAVGLPLAVAMATPGRTVVGVDINAQTVERLALGDPEHLDRGLTPALKQALDRSAIRFSQTLPPFGPATAWILAVATPVDADGTPVMRFFEEAVDALDAAMADGDALAIRATVPIGTTRRLAARLSRPGRRIHIASCPDRSIAGNALSDQATIPHVIGALSDEDADIMEAVFRPLGSVERVSSPETAEALKLFANVYRDVRFAMANEMALVCEGVGIDFSEIAAVGARSYGRFDPGRPGPVGGPCLTKDVHLMASALTMRPRLGLAARAVNDDLMAWCLRAIDEALGDHPATVPIAILGLAFKGVPETRDMRHAFGTRLVERLKSDGRMVRTWDPVVDPAAELEAVVDGAGVVVLTNDHPALGALDLEGIQAALIPDGVIIDMWGARTLAEPPPLGVRRRTFGDGAWTARTSAAG